MDFPELHGWAMTYKEAVSLQRELSATILLRRDAPTPLRTVAGVDVSYRKNGDLFFAGVVVLTYPELTPVEEASASGRVTFPYIPGLLSFRELPVLLQAFRGLQTVPDLVLVDGQGIAHPRRFGIASHLGLWIDRPTVGCAKSRLCGQYTPPGPRRGERSALIDDGEVIGTVLTTRDNVKPLFISPGHRMDVDGAAEIALACGGKYRLPEPTRLAHHLTNRLRIEVSEV